MLLLEICLTTTYLEDYTRDFRGQGGMMWSIAPKIRSRKSCTYVVARCRVRYSTYRWMTHSDVSHNALTGKLPAIWNLTSLRRLYVSITLCLSNPSAGIRHIPTLISGAALSTTIVSRGGFHCYRLSCTSPRNQTAFWVIEHILLYPGLDLVGLRLCLLTTTGSGARLSLNSLSWISRALAEADTIY